MRNDITVIKLPRPMMQHLAAHTLHITRILVADVQNEGAAAREMRADSGQRLLLRLARHNMPEGAERNKGQVELLSQLQRAHILLYQRTTRSHTLRFKRMTSKIKHSGGSINTRDFITRARQGQQ